MNYSDSERVAAVLEKIGYKKGENVEETDLFIFNTCSIRQKGEDRVYGFLKNLEFQKKRNPRLLVGITGCMVRSTSSRNSEKEIKDEIIKKIDTVDFVFRITDTQKLADILLEAEPQLDLPQLETPLTDEPKISEADQQETANGSENSQTSASRNLKDYLKIKPKYSTKFSAFVPIQIGCDKYCTYCIVPYARGREQSRPLPEILAECKTLIEQGCKEITLVGQTVNSYGISGLDKKSGLFDELYNRNQEPFVQLLTEINKLKDSGLNRLRFISSHPHDYTDALIQAHVDLEVLCPHFHLPIQSGSDAVLKKMNRKYTVEDYKKIISKIREKMPNAAITTDIIVGFCSETDEQFEETYDIFKEIRWDMAYISRYSPRRGTVSFNAFKDDVSREEKARRWHKSNSILTECSHEKHEAMVGKILEVLVERYIESTGECEGKSRETKVVQFKGSPDLVGAIVEVKATQALDWLLKGEAQGRKTNLI